MTLGTLFLALGKNFRFVSKYFHRVAKESHSLYNLVGWVDQGGQPGSAGAVNFINGEKTYGKIIRILKSVLSISKIMISQSQSQYRYRKISLKSLSVEPENLLSSMSFKSVTNKAYSPFEGRSTGIDFK